MEKKSNVKTRTPINPIPWWKRGFDVTGAVIGLAILSPLLVLVAVYIRLVSGNPILFKHKRFGYRGEPLYVWKFRSMHVAADPARHQSHVLNMVRNHDIKLNKMDNDSQLIPLGKWLRCSAIDELPQLLNVLVGDMSLVGPRPDVVPLDEYSQNQQKRFDVLPGLTGLWQISGKNHTTFNEMSQLDVQYVEQRSLLLDLKIVILTLPAIFKEIAEDVVSNRIQDRTPTPLPIERQHDSTT